MTNGNESNPPIFSDTVLLRCWIIAGVTMVLSAMLLFSRLGHYPLWDDEAVTALAGRGVWKTGDTSVVLDHNVVAYRSGLLLKGKYERSTPPLGAYVVAPFVGYFGGSPFAVRFPFALFGLASIGFIFFWLYTLKADWLAWLLTGIAIVGNVSFMLYCRQGRYYAPVIFSSLVITWIYLNYSGKKWQLVVMAAAGLMLLSGNYLNYVALHLCLLLDYLIVGKKRRYLEWQEWLIILLPQIILGGMIVLTWNTLATGNKEYLVGNSPGTRLMLIWMNIRDINLCEYAAGVLLLAGAGVYFIRREQPWLWRAPLALFVYVVIVSMLSPQVVNPDTEVADVRYLAPLIPLCIAISVMVLLETRRIHITIPIWLAGLFFLTNIPHFAWATYATPARSTMLAFIGELRTPVPEPYSPIIDWINKNVAPGQSVWVLPTFMAYPLMYHAPHPVYAWQFLDQPPPEFNDLPPIHRFGLVIPDYAIVFGPTIHEFQQSVQPQGYQRDMVAIYPVLWHDQYRPELLWHVFAREPVTQQAVDEGNGIYIIKFTKLPDPTFRTVQ